MESEAILQQRRNREAFALDREDMVVAVVVRKRGGRGGEGRGGATTGITPLRHRLRRRLFRGLFQAVEICDKAEPSQGVCPRQSASFQLKFSNLKKNRNIKKKPSGVGNL